MNKNAIQRYYSESAVTANDAAYEALAWVKETGGTIIANAKGTFENTFDLGTAKKYSSFVNECNRNGIQLMTMRGGYSVKGERLVCLYLIGDELAKVESHLCSTGTSELKETLLVVWNMESVESWIEHYHAKPLNCSNEECGIQPDESNYELPEDISNILEFLASMAAGYGNKMKWNEKEKLKSDLMKNRQAWMRVSIKAIRQKCSELGMTLTDTNTIAELIEKTQAGSRLVPNSSYKNSEFKH